MYTTLLSQAKLLLLVCVRRSCMLQMCSLNCFLYVWFVSVSCLLFDGVDIHVLYIHVSTNRYVIFVCLCRTFQIVIWLREVYAKA